MLDLHVSSIQLYRYVRKLLKCYVRGSYICSHVNMYIKFGCVF